MIFDGNDVECNLISFGESHIEDTFHWIQNIEFQRLFLMRGDITWEGHQQYFACLLNDPSQRIYAILVNGYHVGNCGFKNINIAIKTGELWIYIGESSMRGRGIGLWGTRLLIEEGFRNLKFDSIYLHVADFNGAARALYQKMNFVEVALPQGKEEWANRGCNVIRMELTKSLWM